MPEGPSGSKKTHDKTGDQAATACGVGWPTAEADIAAWTDVYFKRTRKAVERFGDIRVTYAVFMRRPVVSAPRLALDWVAEIGRQRGVTFEVDLRYPEGKWVGAGEPMFYLSGPLSQLARSEEHTSELQSLMRNSYAA